MQMLLGPQSQKWAGSATRETFARALGQSQGNFTVRPNRESRQVELGVQSSRTGAVPAVPKITFAMYSFRLLTISLCSTDVLNLGEVECADFVVRLLGVGACSKKRTEEFFDWT